MVAVGSLTTSRIGRKPANLQKRQQVTIYAIASFTVLTQIVLHITVGRSSSYKQSSEGAWYLDVAKARDDRLARKKSLQESQQDMQVQRAYQAIPMQYRYVCIPGTSAMFFHTQLQYMRHDSMVLSRPQEAPPMRELPSRVAPLKVPQLASGPKRSPGLDRIKPGHRETSSSQHRSSRGPCLRLREWGTRRLFSPRTASIMAPVSGASMPVA